MTLKRFKIKLYKFTYLCESLAELSTCKRGGNGCVIVPIDFSAATFGYTGPPVGIPNDACLDISKQCGCVHAEQNALLKLRGEHTNYRLIVSTTPCLYCAGAILNSRRIEKVLVLHRHHSMLGFDRLILGGVDVVHLQDIWPDGVVHDEHTQSVLLKWWQTSLHITQCF